MAKSSKYQKKLFHLKKLNPYESNNFYSTLQQSTTALLFF
jgi:hypothetical protein